MDDRVHVIDPSGRRKPDKSELSAIKSLSGAIATCSIDYKEVARISLADKMSTLFYLMALSAHFIATSGEPWPASYRNITPSAAEADVLRWMYNGEIDAHGILCRQTPLQAVAMRRPFNTLVSVRYVHTHDWTAAWQLELGHGRDPADEEMPEQDSAIVIGDHQHPTENEDVDIFNIEECEPDFDLFNGDTTSPDGQVTISRLTLAEELFMDDGEVFDSDDEEVDTNCSTNCV